MGDSPRPNWKRPLTTALKIAVSCGLLAWVLHKTNLASIGHSLASANPWWLALALAMGIAGTLVQAKQWQRLLQAVGLDRSITRSLRIVFVGNTFNAIMPSSIGGDASRAVYIADRPGERAPGAAAVALQRLLNFPGMVLLMGFGLALTVTSTAAAKVRPVALLGALIGLVIVGITLSPLIGRMAASTSLARIPGWRPLSTSLRVLDGFRSQRPELIAATGRGAVFWSLTVLNQWAYIRAMGIHPSLGYAALAVTLVNLASMLPLSINGFGAREGGYIALLAGTGLATTAQAASVGLLISAQSLLFGLIGVGCLVTLRSSASWALRLDAATATVVTWLYAPAGWLSAHRLLMSLGIGRPLGKHAVAGRSNYGNAHLDAGTGAHLHAARHADRRAEPLPGADRPWPPGRPGDLPHWRGRGHARPAVPAHSEAAGTAPGQDRPVTGQAAT
jgi:glycosyltransferase 2 family protein